MKVAHSQLPVPLKILKIADDSNLKGVDMEGDTLIQQDSKLDGDTIVVESTSTTEMVRPEDTDSRSMSREIEGSLSHQAIIELTPSSVARKPEA